MSDSTPITQSTEDGEQIHLADFEKKIVLRQLRIEDYDDLVEMQRASFPGMQTWDREPIESQIARFP